jgi:transcriptional regulator with XRE-family HTH domain
VPRRQKSNPLVTRLGKRLHQLRRERGFSLEQMTWGAELAGKGYLSQAERGQALPTLTTLGQIAICLDVELIDMVNFPERSPRHRLLEVTRHLDARVVERLLHDAEQHLEEEGASAVQDGAVEEKAARSTPARTKRAGNKRRRIEKLKDPKKSKKNKQK